MKKLVLIIGLLMALPLVSAKLSSDDILVKRVRFGEFGYVDGPDMTGYVSVHNRHESKRLSDVTVKVRFVDDGFYYSSGDFGVDSRSFTGRSFVSDMDGFESGEYLVKVTVRSDGVRKVKYRYVWID